MNSVTNVSQGWLLFPNSVLIIRLRKAGDFVRTEQEWEKRLSEGAEGSCVCCSVDQQGTHHMTYILVSSWPSYYYYICILYSSREYVYPEVTATCSIHVLPEVWSVSDVSYMPNCSSTVGNFRSLAAGLRKMDGNLQAQKIHGHPVT